MTKTVAIPALVALLVAAAAAGTQASEANREKAAENFMQADVDTDGALTLSEFTTLIDLNAEDGIGRAATIKRFGRYGMAFGRVDANADGLVTPEEMRQLAAQAQN